MPVEVVQETHFPPIFARPFPLLVHPNISTDLHGNILVWHLPGIMSTSTQVRGRDVFGETEGNLLLGW